MRASGVIHASTCRTCDGLRVQDHSKQNFHSTYLTNKQERTIDVTLEEHERGVHDRDVPGERH